jgi:hypothetical protein
MQQTLEEVTTAIHTGLRDVRAARDEIGRNLIAAKQIVGHGNFGRYLKLNFNMSERSAQRYMRFADPSIKSDKVSDLHETRRTPDALASLVRAWKRASDDERSEFLKTISMEIPMPLGIERVVTLN